MVITKKKKKKEQVTQNMFFKQKKLISDIYNLIQLLSCFGYIYH